MQSALSLSIPVIGRHISLITPLAPGMNSGLNHCVVVNVDSLGVTAQDDWGGKIRIFNAGICGPVHTGCGWGANHFNLIEESVGH
ncbi:hypothetical protein HZA71_01755 [Candidatus Falkowbacteria bacterium]|nr:hypothetical protein [Candidatus Falkowbacteria bacterium]